MSEAVYPGMLKLKNVFPELRKVFCEKLIFFTMSFSLNIKFNSAILNTKPEETISVNTPMRQMEVNISPLVHEKLFCRETAIA